MKLSLDGGLQLEARFSVADFAELKDTHKLGLVLHPDHTLMMFGVSFDDFYSLSHHSCLNRSSFTDFIS